VIEKFQENAHIAADMIGKSSSSWTSSVTTERGDLRGYRVKLQHLYVHYRRRSAGGPGQPSGRPR